MAKITLKIGLEYKGQKYPAGQELEVSVEDANKLIGRGIAERVREVVRPKPEAQPAVEAAPQSSGDEK